MNKENRLVIFDSGLGGLSLVHHLKKNKPMALHYCMDNAGFPYGTKTIDELINLITNRINALKRDYDTILIACNTASMVYELFLQPDPTVYSIIQYTIRDAERLNLKRVGVIGSNRLIESEIYQKGLKNLGMDVLVFPASDLVEMVEQDIPISNMIEYLQCQYKSLDTLGLDGLILGCTHFNWLQLAFKTLFSHPVVIIPSGFSLIDEWIETKTFTNKDEQLLFTRPDQETKRKVINFIKNNHILLDA